MTESPGTLFERLLDIMARLRGPQGCPWDREQTHASLKASLIEEAYEVVESIEAGYADHLQEELGDLLLQVVFHARLAEEVGEFSMADLLARLIDKMIRRHPHVFGDATVASAAQALAQWESIKQREAKEQGRSRIAGIPRGLPALLRAQRTQVKAARVGFDWPHARAAWDKTEEERREALQALEAGDIAAFREELGDLLFSLVNVARLAGFDAEDALHQATEKFRRRFVSMEEDLLARGLAVDAASIGEQERSWQSAKAKERDASRTP